MFDSSKTFNINHYASRYLLDVVKIDLFWQTVISAINGIWDVVNDGFIGVIVDRTRTRWGKFRPYLIAFAIPGTIGTIFYWLTPMFFTDNPMQMSKIIYWLVLAVLREGGGTFRSVAETGLLATVTPNPNERMGVLSKSELFSSIYENIPEFLFTIFADLSNQKKVAVSLRTVYMTLGISTTVVCAGLSLYCFFVTKERVMQSVEKPRIRDGLHTIISNRPLLIIMLSDFLGSFSLDTGTDNFYIDVLGSIFLKNIVTLPAAPMYYVSYTYLSWARRRFSTKALWIFGQHLNDVLLSAIFFIGSMGGKGPNGLYRKIPVIIPLLMAKEIMYKSVDSIKKIVPRDLFNEAMDYCEWKNGYRTEGMTLAAKNMITKIVNNSKEAFKTVLLRQIGYDITAGYGGQSDKTKYMMFMMCTLIPSLTRLASIIPKLFYNIDAKTRETMYSELADMRRLKADNYTREELSSSEVGSLSD